MFNNLAQLCEMLAGETQIEVLRDAFYAIAEEARLRFDGYRSKRDVLKLIHSRSFKKEAIKKFHINRESTPDNNLTFERASKELLSSLGRLKYAPEEVFSVVWRNKKESVNVSPIEQFFFLTKMEQLLRRLRSKSFL